MKYVKIEYNKGYFLKTQNPDTNDWVEIDKIDKDELMKLLDKAISSEFEMDEYSETNLGNKTHQIIYGRLLSINNFSMSVLIITTVLLLFQIFL